MERHIEVRSSTSADESAVRALLPTDPCLLFADVDLPRAATSRSVSSSIEVRMGDGAAIRHAITLTVGRVIEDHGDIIMQVHWEPAGHERVLPSFRGAVVVKPDAHDGSLTLSGSYEAPLGHVGRFGDRLIGHRIGRQALQGFADEAAARLDRAALRHWTHSVMSQRASVYNEDLRDRSGTV